MFTRQTRHANFASNALTTEQVVISEASLPVTQKAWLLAVGLALPVRDSRLVSEVSSLAWDVALASPTGSG